MSTSLLGEIALAETLEHKLHLAWTYLAESGTCYTRSAEHRSQWPEMAVAMIHAHGRQGKRSQAIKKIDAIHIVSAYLSIHGGAA
ncbi:hypothetical protein FSC12_01825 [Acinetobacter schindleri]|uniref:hypothetical protein n=1 Tax=Acinetobacter schindleri TaxID=108981 RepID=UPI0013B0A4FB|nr:hypothetical protein [Acinetobacter schindleri]QIC60175.1 hypothetical protein FSC12_01825 [Acinetobacter schindleri]